jgi:phospholipase/carboxylesterase
MNRSIIIQQPDGPPAQLFLLCHGVGTEARDLVPLGERLGEAFPAAWVVSVESHQACDTGLGRQWFSIREISEENRPARVRAALPDFLAALSAWQAESGVGPPGTALIGFSQGAIMALEAALQPTSVAGRVVAIGGRFARLPESAPQGLTLHLIHGKADPVIPYAHTIAAAERLIALGADLTADVLPFVGHQIDDEVTSTLLQRLTTYVPKRLWEAALRQVEGN